MKAVKYAVTNEKSIFKFFMIVSIVVQNLAAWLRKFALQDPQCFETDFLYREFFV